VWKLTILLLWLAVPLCGYAFYRADYARYEQDCLAQRNDCHMRADIVQRYTVYFDRQAQQVPQSNDRDTQRDMERAWSRLQDTLELERKALRTAPPAYFPQADATLKTAEQALADQQKSGEQAMKQHGFALELEQGLLKLEDSIGSMRVAAEYYRREGSASVYYMFQEQLAQFESAYLSRMREHNMFLDNSATELTKERRYCNEAQRATALLNDKLKLDKRLTYQDQLRQRFARFNLGQQLSALLANVV
jgi:hypothetical protein